MSGLLIHHPILRNCQLIIPHPGNADGRNPKDYFIDIDNQGDAIVSDVVWQRLQEARGSGLSEHDFVVMNVVANPPTMRIGVNTDERDVIKEQKKIYKQIRDIAQEFAPDGVVPRIEKDK